MSGISLSRIENPGDGAILPAVYLVGKDADGSEAVGRDTADTAGDARNGAGANGNGNGASANGNGNGNGASANGNGLTVAPADLDEIRADAARRAATELATAALNATDGDTASHSD